LIFIISCRHIDTKFGGGSGIRTHGADEGTTVFKTVAINQTLPSLLIANAYCI
jgi:hypothetical protein